MFLGHDPLAAWDPLNSQPFSELGQPIGSPFLASQEFTDGSETDGPPTAFARRRIPAEARSILEDWFQSHRDNPYLDKKEATELSQATGLTERQVRTFFANSRARRMGGSRPSSNRSSPGPAPESSGATIRSRRIANTSTPSQGSPELNIKLPSRSMASVFPPQRTPSGRQTPGDDDSMSIRSASFQRSSSTARARSRSNSISETPEAAFQSSTPSSTTDIAWGSPSQASIDTAADRAPRRGRKRQRDSILQQTRSIARERVDPQKIFQCTFCPRDFAQKYDWRRHEESVHLPQREWVCMTTGPLMTDPASGFSFCAFCDLPNPPPRHLDEAHNCTACLLTEPADRTFTRKDKLLQHLAQVHKQSAMSRHMAAWERPVQRNVLIKCGICGADIRCWQDRVEHLSNHFGAGQDMRFWIGPPGGILPGDITSGGAGCHAGSTTGTSPPQSRAMTPGVTGGSSQPRITLSPPQASASLFTGGQQQQAPASYTCSLCPLRFPVQSKAIWHERVAHGLYRVQSVHEDE
ncbi:hypothetical protein BDY21DRAFT_25232 [Lineolata rhizophorae]|uniref:Homeobox domain-containing protein n=1 Tax=Lineolata rhizophorae TaxID=578093 RepID=A0A6A6P069_9PEZI|nr:hypothetical protein BDY21DRAFT_25232 [Lineolata rhizophorae]